MATKKGALKKASEAIVGIKLRDKQKRNMPVVAVDKPSPWTKRHPQNKRPMAPQSLANLAPPFPRGVSGNPSGRPKGSGTAKISKAYEARLGAIVPEHFKKKLGLEDVEGDFTWADAIAYRACIQATRAQGPVAPSAISLNTIRELREVTEGPIPTKIEQTGKDGAPLSAPPLINVQFVEGES